MDKISTRETSVLGKFYMDQEHNAPFMTKIVNFAFFPWTLLGHSKKTLASLLLIDFSKISQRTK